MVDLFGGIDPGRKGWLVVYDGTTIVGAWKLPHLELGGYVGIDAVTLCRMLASLKKRGLRFLVVERQQVMGVEGKSSAFTTGHNYGILVAVSRIVMGNDGCETPTPGDWKKVMQVPPPDKVAKLDAPPRPDRKDRQALAAWKLATKDARAKHRKLKAEQKSARKDNAVIRAEQVVPGYDFRARGDKSRDADDNKAEAGLLAVYACQRFRGRGEDGG